MANEETTRLYEGIKSVEEISNRSEVSTEGLRELGSTGTAPTIYIEGVVGPRTFVGLSQEISVALESALESLG